MRPVVIIAKAFPPSTATGAARPYRFFKYLPRYDYAPVVVSEGYGQDARRQMYPAPGPAPRTAATVISRIAERAQRWFLPYDDSYPWLPFAIAEASRAIRETGAEVVCSTSPTIANHLAALAVKGRFGVRWVADFRDPLLGNPFRTSRRARCLDTAVERLIFRSADALIANTDCLANMWRRRHPRWADKITVLWNGYDPEDVTHARPIASNRRRVLAHIGNIYHERTPDLLLASLDRLISHGALSPDDIIIDLVGLLEERSVAVDRPPFKTLVERGCLAYTGHSIPRPDARRRMAEADYLLLLDVNGAGASLQVPAKLFEYVWVGRPILAVTTAGSPVERILAECGIPHSCIYSSMAADEMDRRVLAFLRQAPSTTPPSRRFIESFDGAAQTAALAGRFNEALAASRRRRAGAVGRAEGEAA